MRNSKRALSLAACGLMVVAMTVVPAASPAASDVIATNLAAADLQLTAPTDAMLHADDDGVLLQDDMVAAEAPVATDDAAEIPLDLPRLVEEVARLNAVELSSGLRCLASAVYNEARGESLEGQLAVAQVVLNRVASDRWPDSLCGVVFQAGQFSFTFDGRPDYPADNFNWRRAEAVAIVAATKNWKDVTDQALFFHASYVSPSWERKFEKTRRIGRHVFYR